MNFVIADEMASSWISVWMDFIFLGYILKEVHRSCIRNSLGILLRPRPSDPGTQPAFETIQIFLQYYNTCIKSADVGTDEIASIVWKTISGPNRIASLHISVPCYQPNKNFDFIVSLPTYIGRGYDYVIGFQSPFPFLKPKCSNTFWM